jgi:type II secretory pathway predicted ATPase ExeA
MDLGEAGLHEQPFRAIGEPLALSSYAEHRKARAFLNATYGHKHGLGLLQGPTLSGKSTTVWTFLKGLDSDIYTAIVDGRGLTPRGLLRSILKQFGYPLQLETVGELTSMLRVIVMQQTASGKPPLLIIDNCQELQTRALRTICDLADIKANRQSAIRMIMVCQRSIDHLINDPELQGIAVRITGVHQLQPMDSLETRDYLHAKLYAAGAPTPSSLFPEAVCSEIYLSSGGWPGIVDRLGLFALAKATSLPVTPDLVEHRQLPDDMRRMAAVPTLAPGDEDTYAPPRLLVSRDGELLDEIELKSARLLIGRSAHNDLSIDSRFVSRHHALLVSHGSSTLLMDLNSTNGTFVNSRRISNYVLRHEDIISLGSYRVKFVHPTAEQRFVMEESGLAETAIMKTLEDMRHMLSGESTQTMPQAAMDKLAGGGKD